MNSGPDRPLVYIHYRRPPDRIEVYVQTLLFEDDGIRITYQPELPLRAPKTIGGTVAMEPGSPVVWFTFPETWHDIGLFHTADGTFTGLYCNILTPPLFVDRLTWHTTDLFLDIWIPAEGGLQVLDRDQFDDAVGRGHVSPEDASHATAEVARLEAAARAGLWPPPVVREWDLERARQES